MEKKKKKKKKKKREGKRHTPKISKGKTNKFFLSGIR